MKRLIRRSASMLALLFVLGFAPHVDAGIIFESGTLGETGVTWQQALDEEVPASSVKSTVFTGVRFELTQTVVTSEIGGHFFSPSGGSFFGAIISLEDEDDFPDSGDLLTPDKLGATLLTFPVDSSEVFGDLALTLEPGWYALVFGSGLLGADGDGGAVGNGMDIGAPTYIGHQLGAEWFDFAIFQNPFEDYRLVVKGIVVPEPSTLILSTLAAAFLLWRSCVSR